MTRGYAEARRKGLLEPEPRKDQKKCSACGKLSYKNKHAALTAIAEHHADPRFKDNKHPRKFYRCVQTGSYHLTSGNSSRLDGREKEWA